MLESYGLPQAAAMSLLVSSCASARCGDDPYPLPYFCLFSRAHYYLLINRARHKRGRRAGAEGELRIWRRASPRSSRRIPTQLLALTRFPGVRARGEGRGHPTRSFLVKQSYFSAAGLMSVMNT